MVSESITAATAAQAGLLASLIALLSRDLDLLMVLVVGVIGGAMFFFKEWTHLTVKTTKLKALAELMFTIPMSVSTAGVVFYLGTNGVNTYLDVGTATWIFFALMASLHYKTVVHFFSRIIVKIVEGTLDSLINLIKNYFNGRK